MDPAPAVFLNRAGSKLEPAPAPHMEEKVQNALQNFIHKEFSDINPILTIYVLAGKIVKFPSTTALKGILNFFFHV